ncbi:MAG TPA: secretin N-terminal domain-containing protein [Candidatus Omnitrophota bacterium]|nr:secretin N-terminal domain-containing protein [Candidatus Omnitrophota bacterium]
MKKHNILIMSFFLSFVCLYPLCAQEQKDTAVPLVKEEGRGIVTHEASPQPENVVEEPEPTIEEEPTAENTEAENAEEEIRPSTQEEAKSAEESKVEETSMTLETLELKDMDILDILKLISKKSGLNIAAGKNVKGRITIFLKDVNVWDALRIILETNDLAYSQEEGIVKVMTAKEYETIYGKKFTDKTSVKIIPLKFANAGAIVPLLTQIKSAIGKVIADEKSNTVVIIDTPQNITSMEQLINHIDVSTISQVFTLRYAKAEDIQKGITGILTPNVGRIDTDSRTNKIVVTDTAVNMEKISKMIAAFDEKTPEVTIEAKILQIDLSDQFQMGVDWDKIFHYNNIKLAGNFDVDTGASGSTLTVGSADFSKYSYYALIEALNTVGKTNTLSTPRITVLNNQEAKILVGTKEVYVSTTTTNTTGISTTAEEVTFVDVGVTLSVTPTINADGFVTMKIKPEVSSTGTPYTTASGNKIPVVSTSVAETNVMVKDGTTIIIGGLIKDKIQDTIKKLPFFGDIPLLGLAFRSKDKTTTKTELAIFLTPHIISGESDYFKPYSRQDAAFQSKLGTQK